MDIYASRTRREDEPGSNDRGAAEDQKSFGHRLFGWVCLAYEVGRKALTRRWIRRLTRRELMSWGHYAAAVMPPAWASPLAGVSPAPKLWVNLNRAPNQARISSDVLREKKVGSGHLTERQSRGSRLCSGPRFPPLLRCLFVEGECTSPAPPACRHRCVPSQRKEPTLHSPDTGIIVRTSIASRELPGACGRWPSLARSCPAVVTSGDARRRTRRWIRRLTRRELSSQGSYVGAVMPPACAARLAGVPPAPKLMVKLNRAPESGADQLRR